MADTKIRRIRHFRGYSRSRQPGARSRSTAPTGCSIRNTMGFARCAMSRAGAAALSLDEGMSSAGSMHCASRSPGSLCYKRGAVGVRSTGPAPDHIRDRARRWPTPKYAAFATSADTADRANLAQGAVRPRRLAVRYETVDPLDPRRPIAKRLDEEDGIIAGHGRVL